MTQRRFKTHIMTGMAELKGVIAESFGRQSKDRHEMFEESNSATITSQPKTLRIRSLGTHKVLQDGRQIKIQKKKTEISNNCLPDSYDDVCIKPIERLQNQMIIYQSTGAQKQRESLNIEDSSNHSRCRNNVRLFAATDNPQRPSKSRTSGSQSMKRRASSMKSANESRQQTKVDSSLMYAGDDARYQVDIKQPALADFKLKDDRPVRLHISDYASYYTTSAPLNASIRIHDSDPTPKLVSPPGVNQSAIQTKNALGLEINAILEEIEVQTGELSNRALKFENQLLEQEEG